MKKSANIRIIAPASPPDIKVLWSSITLLKKMGFNITLGQNIRKLVQRADLAAPDKDRAEEFNAAFKDDSVDAIFCARGGYGSMRILPLIDYDNIKSHPKIFVGYISEGTNISLFASLVGTDYMPDTKNRIGFFEDIATTSSDVDRYLFRLKLAKALDKFNGFVFGDFVDIPTSDEILPSMEEIIESYMLELQKPSLYGFPFGHGEDQMLIPLNAKIRISSDEPYMELLEEVVN